MDIFMDAAGSALLQLLTPTHFGFLCLGVVLGLIIGILPGLGGVVGLSLLLPLIYGMDPAIALALMMGLLAPLATSDTFTAILMGIPGSSGAQAVVMDGFPLARRGEAARALAASFMASLVGGLVGAAVLTAAAFVARPLILSMGFGELMMLVIFSLSMVGTLTGESALKGLAACGLGLLFGVIGTAPATGEERLTFESLYLTGGLSIIVVALGMFALPEIIDLLRHSQTISNTRLLGGGWLQGLRDTLRNKWLILRCSGIGCLIGALPGLGGSVVEWIAYGHVVQTSKDRSQFGKGDIRGVIAPESANNAVMGGALFPTLFLGVPGSGTMAVMLAAFMLIGIEPGIGMMERHLDLTFTTVWSLALANVLGAGACFLLAPQIAKLTRVRYALVGPVMLVIIAFAALQVTQELDDLLALFAVGLLGLYMKRFGWPRPAFLIGFVLSRSFESSVYQAVQVYGLSFLGRPIVIAMILLTAASVLVAFRMRRRTLPTGDAEATEAAAQRRAPQIAFTALLLSAVLLALWETQELGWLGAIFPRSVAVATLALILPVLLVQLLARRPMSVLADEEAEGRPGRGALYYAAWIGALYPLVLLLGFPIAAGVFVFALATTELRGSPGRTAALALACVASIALVAQAFALSQPAGLLGEALGLPVWLGGAR